MINLHKHLDLLGMQVRDQVTGYSGVVTSVCFDLYGCIQAVVNPGTDKDGKLQEASWFDVGRLTLVSNAPVMKRPEFDWSPEKISGGYKGPAEKPAMNKA